MIDLNDGYDADDYKHNDWMDTILDRLEVAYE